MVKYEERKRWVFFGLPFSFTVYTIGDEVIKRKEGFFTTKEDDCYLYKIQDVTLRKTLFERMFKLGTIICHTGDTTDPTLTLYHIKNSDEIKEYLSKASDEERMKRRTINTLNITAGDTGDDL